MSDVRKQEIARAAGVSPDQLREIKASIVDRLAREGVLVRVHIGRWRASHKLSPQDLGLDPKEAKPLLEQVELGRKLLLPRQILDELRRIEDRGRRNLQNHSLDTLLGPFMPASEFPRFRTEHEKLKEEYMAIRDQIVGRLPELREQVARAFRNAAEAIYPRVASKTNITLEEFREEYTQRALRLFPDEQTIRNSFYFEYELAYVPLSSELVAEEARRAEIVRNQQLREELRRHVYERKKEEVDRFLTDVVQRLRSIVYHTVSSALNQVRRGKVPRSTVEKLRNLVERVSALNVYGDAEIERAIRELEKVVGTSGPIPHVPPSRLETVLADLEEVCRTALNEAFNVDSVVERIYAIDIDSTVHTAPGADPGYDERMSASAPAVEQTMLCL
jgi:hypothetical protein